MDSELDAAQLFLALSPDAVVITDADGTILVANRLVSTLFGYELDDIVGAKIEMLIPDRYREAHIGHRAAFAQHPHHRPMGLGLELQGRRRDGSEFPVDVSIGSIRTSEGLLATAAIRDITQRKQLEAVRDRFIANAAHELRTPLTAIRAAAEVLDRRRADLTGPQADRALDALVRQCRQATVLVDNLLDLSNLDRHHLRLELQPVPLAVAVQQSLETVPPPDGVEVSIDGVDPGTVLADPARLAQILVNLVTNAYRYGGPHVAISATRCSEVVRVAVEDDGCGVEPGLELFEPFARGRAASTSGGSGIGLSLCRSLVEAHGGSIWHEPVEPHGARLVFTLPVAP